MPSERDRLNQRARDLEDRAAGERGVAGRTRGAAEEAITQFDPSRALGEDIFGSFFPGIQRQAGRISAEIRADQNRRGVLDTGAFDGEFRELLLDRISEGLAGRALQGAQLGVQNQSNRIRLADLDQRVARGTEDRSLELDVGEVDRQTAEANAKRKSGGLFGKVLGTALGAAGAAFGGPILGAAGQAVAGRLFPGQEG